MHDLKIFMLHLHCHEASLKHIYASLKYIYAPLKKNEAIL